MDAELAKQPPMEIPAMREACTACLAVAVGKGQWARGKEQGAVGKGQVVLTPYEPFHPWKVGAET